MSPRSLFNIILKVLGLFIIKDFLATVGQFLSIVLFFTKRYADTEASWALITTLLILLVYGLASYYLIFKTDVVIDKLKLDKGFDQDIIPLSIHRSTILSISIIVLGGYLVADEIPNFCRQLFSHFQEGRTTSGLSNPKIQYSILSATKIAIGYLLMAEQRQFVNWIERKRTK